MKIGRSTKEGAGSLLNLLLVLGILILIQYLSYRFPHEWDLTKNKRFTLSELTRKELSTLKSKIEVWAFIDSRDRQTRDLINQYQKASTFLDTHLVDPRSQPTKALEFGVNGQPPILVFKWGERQEQVAQPNEERITNALHRLISGPPQSAYVLEGHGEGDLNATNPDGYSTLRDSLVGEGSVPKPLMLYKEKMVPSDARCVVVLDPRYPIYPNEKQSLKAYLNDGGHLLFFAGIDLAPSWIEFLQTFGVKLQSDLVIDSSLRIANFGPEILVAMTYHPHPITAPFMSLSSPPPIILPLARSVEMEPSIKGITLSPLASTTGHGLSYAISVQGKKITTNTKKALQKGIINVVQAATISKIPGKTGRLVVIGTRDFADNQWISTPSANRDLTLNALSWLTESQDSIAIHPPPNDNPSFMLDENAMIRLLLLTLLVIPAFGIVLGVGNWIRRRNL